jgi:hypothetical protein
MFYARQKGIPMFTGARHFILFCTTSIHSTNWQATIYVHFNINNRKLKNTATIWVGTSFGTESQK